MGFTSIKKSCTTWYEDCFPAARIIHSGAAERAKLLQHPLLPFTLLFHPSPFSSTLPRAGRDLKDCPVPTPCHGQGCLGLGQVAQRPIIWNHIDGKSHPRLSAWGHGAGRAAHSPGGTQEDLLDPTVPAQDQEHKHTWTHTGDSYS